MYIFLVVSGSCWIGMGLFNWTSCIGEFSLAQAHPMIDDLTKEEAVVYLRTKFVKKHLASRLIRKHELTFKKGEYNKVECALLDSAIKKFFSENGLTMRDLHAFLLEENEAFPIRRLLIAMSDALQNRLMNSVWIYLSYHYHPYVNEDWEPENEVQLLNLVRAMGFKWKRICMLLYKSSRKCIKKYHDLMGYSRISKSLFKLENDEIPTSEEEWNKMCCRLRISRERLSVCINAYISRKLFTPYWNEYNDMTLIAYVLRYNYFCSLRIKIEELQEFIERGSVSEDGGVNREEILRKADEFMPDLSKCDLGVEIETEDIFWRNIQGYMNFSTVLLRARFLQLCKTRNLRTYERLLGLFRTLVAECYIMRLKDRLKEEIERMMVRV
jgi:hypothetical protein